MKPQFVPVILGGRRGATPFTPARLFTSGVAGAWYDPSDYSTLFQDSAGTTPVTAVEQPVGLMLDKSQGLVLGSELVTNGDFASSSGWTLPATGTNSITGGQAVLSGASGYLLRTGTSITAGQWYRVSFTVSGYSGSGTVRPYIQASPVFGSNVTGNGTFVQYLLATTTNANTEIGLNFASSFTGNIDDISIKSFAGNHASQATAASRPVLRARYNLLTYSEQFDNVAWSKPNTTITANSVVAPDGTTTADLVTATNGADATCNQTVSGVNAAGVVLTFTFYARCASGTVTLPVLGDDGTGKFWSNPNTNKVTVTTAWQRFTVTGTAPALSASVARAGFGGFSSWTTGDAVYIWGADLRTGSSAGTYQRIAAATDYATAGFAPYLAFDGVDDFLGAAYVQSAYPLTITAGVNNDTSSTSATGIVSVAVSDASYKQLRDDTFSQTAAMDRNATQLVSPIITAVGNKFCFAQIETSLITHQVNGGTPATLANTNAFGTTASIFVGKTRPAGLFSAARDYGVVITNTVLTAAEKDSLKNWMASKMGVTL